jgi:hypothetical protein
MSSRLSPALTEFTDGRWPGDARGIDPRNRDPREMDPQDMDPQSIEPPLHPSELDRFEREPWPLAKAVARWVPVAFVRFMIFFFVGIVTTLAWQSYNSAARRMVASLSPGLGWLAPPAAPGSPVSGPAAAAAPDQLAAISRSLAAVRQSVDKLAADVTRLQAATHDPPPVRTSGLPAAPPPAPAVTQGRKPAATAQVQPAR